MPATVAEWLNVMTLAGILCTAIYSLIRVGRWAERIVGGLDRVESQLLAHNRRFDDVDSKFADVSGRFLKIEKQIQGLPGEIASNGSGSGS